MQGKKILIIYTSQFTSHTVVLIISKQIDFRSTDN